MIFLEDEFSDQEYAAAETEAVHVIGGVKHLEGQHDQSTHGRPGESGPETEWQIKATVHQVEDEIRKSYAAEVIVCIGADGKEIIRKQGEQDKCALTPEEMQQMVGAKVVTHNHPGGWSRDEDDPRYKGNSFSDADVRLAVALRVGEMRVVSPGYRYSLKIPQSFVDERIVKFEEVFNRSESRRTNDENAMVGAFGAMYLKMKRGEFDGAAWVANTVAYTALRRADKGVRATFQPRIQVAAETSMEAADVEIAKAEANHAHEVMLRVSKELGWTYTREEYKEWPKSSTKPQSKSSGSTASHRSLTKSAPRRKRMGGLGITRKQLHALHLKKHGKQEQRMAKALEAYFSGVVDDVAGKLSGSIDADDPEGTAERLIDQAFDADKHLEDLVKAISPHMAAAFADGAVTEYKLGRRAHKAIVERMQTKERQLDPSYDPEHPEECCPHCGARQERVDDGKCNRCGKPWPEKQAKSTASDLLEELGLDFPETFATEVPQWVVKAATDAMIEAFEEDYWMELVDGTRADLMATLQHGIREGVSIRDLAAEIKEIRGDEYAKWRATNTARTESNWMLSRGAREGVKQTAEETGLPMGLEWNSLFSSTSRQNHMDFDATETESADGMFQFPGQDGTVYEISAPGDPKLPPADRCNCLCFLVSTIVSGELSQDDSGNVPDAADEEQP